MNEPGLPLAAARPAPAPGTPPEELLRELRWLRALARRLVADPGRADDLVQETVLAALVRRRTGASLRAWLAAILRNARGQEGRARARRERRERAAARPEATRATADVVAELALFRRLVEHVEALDEPYKSVLVLRFLRGRSPREIARALERPVKTVHTQIERGLARLRARLDRASGGDRDAWLAALVPFGRADLGPLAWGVGGALVTVNAKLVAIGAGTLAAGALLSLPWILRAGPGAPPSSDGPPAPPTVALEAPRAEGDAPIAAPVAAPAGEPARDPVAAAPPPPPAAEPSAPRVFGSVRTLEGHPVAGIDVLLIEGGVRRPLAPSAADGSFSLALPERWTELDVGSELFAAVARPTLDGSRPVQPPTIVVAPRCDWAGIVVDREGRPVPNAPLEVAIEPRLRLVALAGGRDAPVVTVQSPIAVGATDAAGRFALRGVGFVEGAALAVERDQRTRALQLLPAHSDEDLVVVLDALASPERAVHGRVVDASARPVPEALISLGGASVVSDADGAFVLPRTPAWFSSGTLRALAPGYLPASARVTGEAGERGASADDPLVLVLAGEPLEVHGRVVDAGGRPVAGASVWTPETTHFGTVVAARDLLVSGEATVEALLGRSADGTRASEPVEATTDADGRFALRGLLPRDYALFAVDPRTLSGAGPVVARAGQEGVELALASDGLESVAGRVVSTAGEPLAGVSIALVRGFEWAGPGAEAAASWRGKPLLPPRAERAFYPAERTDGGGRFALSPLSRRGVRLRFYGGPLFLAQDRALDREETSGELVIELTTDVWFRVVAEDPSADEVRLLDAEGEVTPILVPLGARASSLPGLALVDGRSPLARVAEGARTLVLLRDGEELARAPVALAPPRADEDPVRILRP